MRSVEAFHLFRIEKLESFGFITAATIQEKFFCLFEENLLFFSKTLSTLYFRDYPNEA